MKLSILFPANIIRVALLYALLWGWGCSQPVQHEVAPGVQDTQSAQASLDPVISVIREEPESQSWPIVDLPQAQHTSALSLQEPSPSFPASSQTEGWLKGVELKTRVFLSKDGALLGDFTVMNKNPVPITEVKIGCAEYDPNQMLLKTTSRVISAQQWIGADREQFFGEIEFAYVDDAFETVTCRLQSLNVANSTVSLQ